MKISMKTDYAFRALFTLVEHYQRGPIPIRELARRNNVPKRFLEHIMLEMKAKGWVASTMGKQGGYILAKPPHKITAGEVIRHFDGVLAPIGCVSLRHYEHCDQRPVCRFRSLFLDVRNYAAKRLDHTSLADVFQNMLIQDDEALAAQFTDGAGI
ncbi:MAG TPA: Rrf2 family transcriptional regulator [Anaerohalosphaeraceae bacterium]|nr:Rrf2 family transcriptional regulator [Phycisphaerae bacterium]HOK95331.1 Rrf2 family transcriptional regulator [Anaerohalosphaeraceae bacterium]HOL32335.1 Rrf2 family transcriptional regulator [Anaerohalosphaeraceae bacterium]HOM74932.1 Rrf2 family transcriptional regulator [Anaerohalosphaeraceae bacterium]HPC64933.1 Rrf2 family transcriptional regulator [Anaerohalosphaeraceae bacterium]